MNKVYLLPVLSRVSGVGGWWAARMGVGPFAKKKNLRGVGWDPGFPVARKDRNCNASDKPQTTFLQSRHCLVIFSVFILLF